MSAKDTTCQPAGVTQVTLPGLPPSIASSGGRWYQIKVKGRLDPHWSTWLGGLEIGYDNQGHTLLSGLIPDQAALFGILLRLRDLGVALVGLICFEDGGESQTPIKSRQAQFE